MKHNTILLLSLLLTSTFANADTVQCQGKDVKISTFTSTTECYQKYGCAEATILEVTCKDQTVAVSAQVPSEDDRPNSFGGSNSATTHDITMVRYTVTSAGAKAYQSSKMKGYLATILTAKSLNAQLTLKFEKNRDKVNGHPRLDGVTLE